MSAPTEKLCECGHDELSHRIMLYESRPVCASCFPKSMALHPFETDNGWETTAAVPSSDWRTSSDQAKGQTK